MKLKNKNIENPKKHGILESDARNINLENMDRKGFTILKGLLCKDCVLALKQKLDEVRKKQTDEVGGEENLVKIRDAGIYRELCAYDPIFLKKVLMNETVINYLDILLDKSFTLYSQVGVIQLQIPSYIKPRGIEKFNISTTLARVPKQSNRCLF